MRKLLWMVLFFCAYVWVMTSGHDRMLLEYGKGIYRSILLWLEDAEIDMQTKQKPTVAKKRSRRWD